MEARPIRLYMEACFNTYSLMKASASLVEVRPTNDRGSPHPLAHGGLPHVVRVRWRLAKVGIFQLGHLDAYQILATVLVFSVWSPR